MHKLQVRSIAELVQLTSFGRDDGPSAPSVIPLEPPPRRSVGAAGHRPDLRRAVAEGSFVGSPWGAATGAYQGPRGGGGGGRHDGLPQSTHAARLEYHGRFR